MSARESAFIKWVAGIFATVIILVLAWTYTVLGNVDVMQEQIHQNKEHNTETREFHKEDALLIREYIREIRADQKETKQDIKEILKRL